MVRPVLVLAVCVTMVTVPVQASAATRPGTVEARLAGIALGDDVQALSTTQDHTILVAGRSGSGAFTFVRALLSDGSPDPGFGSAGEVRLEGGPYYEVAALAVQPDGRILVGRAGANRLSRLNRDGSLDPSFGTGGSIDLDFRSGAPFFLTVAVAPDGRIVVASTPQSSPDVQVRRYLPNGTPDASFGANGQTAVIPPHPHFYSTLAVQPDGRIVIVTDGGGSGLQIARLSSDGTVDPGFGGGGVGDVELGRRRFAGDVHAPYGLEWRPLSLPDGRIRLPVGVGPRERVTRMGVVGLTANGHAERRFGRQGLALGPRIAVSEGGEFPRVAVADAAGSLLVAASTASGDDLSGEDGSIVRRFRRNGTLDLSFGRHGVMAGPLRSAGQSFEQQLALLDRHTAVIADESWIPKYQSRNGGIISTLNAGYDRDDPITSLVAGCRYIRVTVRDMSGLAAVVVRAGGRVVKRTHAKRFRVRTPPRGRRLTIRATDLAGNSSRLRARLPGCRET
jgi:uncharacterized delta-60 repeat protein